MEPVTEVRERAVTDLGALLDAGDGAVVTLEAGKTRLAAHKAVLSARSPVFAAMFQHDMLETNSSIVTIPDVEGPVLRLLLVFMYTLQVPQMGSRASQLLAAADKYGLLVLKSACQQQMATQLSVETAVATAILALRHSCTSLKNAAITFIRENLVQVMTTQGWADAVVNDPHSVVELTRLIGETSPEIRNLSRVEKSRRLLEAAQQGAAGEVRQLLSAGADVGAVDDKRFTALRWAADEGHVEAARCLLEGGADVNARDRRQETPLHRAVWCRHVEVVRLLLSYSALLNLRDADGDTPLHDAAYQGCAEEAAALIEAGADREIRNNGRETPLDVAKFKNNRRLVEILSRR